MLRRNRPFVEIDESWAWDPLSRECNESNSVTAVIANHQRIPPGKKSEAHYVVWLQELADLQKGGMVSDEEYALSKAERLEHLFDPLVRPWRKWVFGALPLVLFIGGALSYLEQRLDPLLSAGMVAVLCVMAAIGVHSRVLSEHMTKSERLTVIRELLARDLITSEEFAAFEHRIMAMP